MPKLSEILAEDPAMLEQFKKDMLIVLLARLGGKAIIPVEEIDEMPKGKALMLGISEDTPGAFEFLVVNIN